MFRQRGLGLPELLIALLLASFITNALWRHYLNVKQHYRFMQTTLEQSMDLQMVSELMRDGIRRAGFTPCLGIEQLTSLDTRTALKQLRAIEVTDAPHASVKINRMKEHFSAVLEIKEPTEVLVNHYPLFKINQTILLADCYHAEVHTIRKLRHTAQGQMVSLMKPLHYTYHAPWYVGEWIEESYFIHSAEKVPHLWYTHQHTEELSAVIHALSARIDIYQGRRLVEVFLELVNSPNLEIAGMVRMP